MINDYLPKERSYLKHLPTNYPNLKYLSKILHGLVESFPEYSIDHMLQYINSWPGISGKMTQQSLRSVKHSAQSSFIKSYHSSAYAAKVAKGSEYEANSTEPFVHSLLKDKKSPAICETAMNSEQQSMKGINTYPPSSIESFKNRGIKNRLNDRRENIQSSGSVSSKNLTY